MSNQVSLRKEWAVRSAVAVLSIPFTLLMGALLGQLFPVLDQTLAVIFMLLVFLTANVTVPIVIIQKLSERSR